MLESKANAGEQVTAIDVSKHHDQLIAGYESGTVILWDLFKGKRERGRERGRVGGGEREGGREGEREREREWERELLLTLEL